MSQPDLLTEDDRRLLDAIDSDIRCADSAEEYRQIVSDLRDELLEVKIQQRENSNRLDRLEEQLQGRETAEERDGPPIVHYANIPAENRAEALTTSQEIAVAIHENWDDIAWTLGGGSNYSNTTSAQRTGVDTKTAANAKHNPSRLRHRLKQLLDRDPQWNEIYRGLKQLAKLSGGSERADDTNSRVAIVGGMYHYEERATADGSDTKRVCWRVNR